MNHSEKFWDKTAQRYANSPVSDEATYFRKLSETQDYLTPDMHVLEFGCGTGTTAVHHAPHVQRIDAIDISGSMLEIARSKARSAGVDNITFTRATLTGFGADAASLDAVLALNVLHLLPDRQEVIAEVARILRPGGVFVSSTVCLGGSFLRFLTPIVSVGKVLGLLPSVYVLTEAELADEITRAGFAIERRWHHARHGIAVFMIAIRQ